MEGLSVSEESLKRLSTAEYNEDDFEKNYEKIYYDNCHFSNMIISNVSFENCVFDRCSFIKVEFHNVYFVNCKIIDTSFTESMLLFSIDNGYIHNVFFKKCSTRIDLDKISRKSDTDGLSILDQIEYEPLDFRITNSDIVRLYVQDTYLFRAKFENNKYRFLYFNKESTLDGISISTPRQFFNIHFDEGNMPIISSNSSFPSLKHIKHFIFEEVRMYSDDKNNGEVNNDIQAFVDFYMKLSDYFHQRRMENLYGKYYYLMKRCERYELRGTEWKKSKFQDILCGYGEKWFNAVYISITIIFLFAFIYMWGLQINENYTMTYRLLTSFDQVTWVNLLKWFKDFGYSLYFSMMTFTTVG